jgi:biopolymer transport protein ExbB/TolQ
MDSALLIILTIFIGLTTIAMIAQAVALLGMTRVAKQSQEKLNNLLPEVARTLDAAQNAVTQTGKLVNDANARTVEILDLTKDQLTKVDDLLKDAITRAKVQMERAEMVLDDAMTRTQSTVAIVQRGVISPIREVHGVLTGIRTALLHLGRGNRPTVDHATSDEEMFI